MLLPHKLGLEWWQTDDCQRRPPREIVTRESNTQVAYETINWRRNEQVSTKNALRMFNGDEWDERGWKFQPSPPESFIFVSEIELCYYREGKFFTH